MAAPPKARYVLSAELDFGWKTLVVQQQATIPNPSSQPISEIVLVVQPNWYPGVFQLQSLTWGDGSPVASYSLEGIRLTIALAEPLPPGESQQFALGYTLKLTPLERGEEFGPNPFGYTSRQVNLTDWYPFAPPFTEAGWLVHNPWFYGEHLVYPVADFEVEFRLSNAPAGTLIAASAPDEGDGDTHRYRMQAARNFVLSISPEYQLFERQVGEVTLLGYAFLYDAEIGEAAFEATVEAYALYSELFGPYPHRSLTMVEADFNHGMEYAGLYYLSKGFFNTYDGSPASYLVAIAVHETAHQWWFGLVGNDQALEPWLDEALCTYSERLFYEKRYPEALDWWWEFRVNYYQPAGWVDSDLYTAGGYRPYRDAVYLQGALFLEELRTLVGDQAFFAFLRDYLARLTNGLATTADFFSILHEHSQTDWNPLLEKYFQSTPE